MASFATALAPVMALILVGFALKRSAFLPAGAWPGIERLTYFVLFPSLLVGTLGGQSLTGLPWQGILIVVVAVVLIAAAVLLGWYGIRRSTDGPTFTSIFQGGVRFNTYIALAVAQPLFGREGLAMAAVAAGFMIVLVNVLSVFALIRFGHARRRGLMPYVREVVANPLVLACAVGWCLSLSGVGLPGVTADIVEVLGRAALPLGLLAVGAALKPEAVSGHVGAIATSSIVQFVVKPLSAVLVCSAAGVTGVAAAILLIILMTPTAPSAYILARQLGGDAQAMASIITFQTLLAFLAMPLIATMAGGLLVAA